MGINLISPSTSTSAVLIADTVKAPGGSNDAIPQMTQVGGVPVSACLELQSTLGGLVLPRMTAAQIAAIVTPVNGMQAFNTDTNSVNTFQSNGWVGAGPQRVTVTLNQANILGMYAAPVAILAAPGAGKSIIVHKAAIVNNFHTAAFAAGGVAILQYGNSAHGAGTNALSDTFTADLITAAASSLYSLPGGLGATTLITATANLGLFISNQTAAFTTGNAASTVVVDVWYSVINT